MAGQTTQPQVECFNMGDEIPYTGEYIIVDKQGKKQNYEPMSLEEGEVFPNLDDLKGKDLFFTLNEPCGDDEQCEVIGEPTPDID